MNTQTTFVSCYDEHGAITGTHLTRSPLLISPNGEYKAYTEAEAFVVGPQGGAHPYIEGPGCVNFSRLFVAGPKTNGYDLIFLLEPRTPESGNGIQAFDWSPDSRFLLIAFIRWTYESEWCCPKLLIYDTKFSVFTQPDESQVFSKHMDKECFVEISPQGFSPDGNVVVKASPWDEEMFGETSCLKEAGVWLLDPHSSQLTKLPADYKVQRYGRFEKHARKK